MRAAIHGERRTSSFLFPLAFGLLLGSAVGCATLGLGGVNLISIEEEWEMGRELEAELAEELTLSDDRVVTEYVNRIGELLVSHSDLADLDWRFHVVEDPAINAFNVPGGLVYVNTGLIAEVDHAAELVGVIGHELGHGVARHGTERLTQQYGLAILAGIVLGEEPGTLQQIVAQVVAAGAIAQFSQEQEHEADELGVQFMALEGYHPEGMIILLERLMELQEREPGSVEQFFGTHPGLPDRIAHIEDEMEAWENRLADLQLDDAEFDGVQARVR